MELNIVEIDRLKRAVLFFRDTACTDKEGEAYGELYVKLCSELESELTASASALEKVVELLR